MRRQRVNFGYSAHRSNERRTDGSSGSYDITVIIGLLNKTVCDIVHDRKSVPDDRTEFFLDPCLDDRIQHAVMSIELICSGISDITNVLCGMLDLGRICSVREGLQTVFDHVSYLVGVGDYDLHGFRVTQVFEFREHLLGGPEVQVALKISVLEPHIHHDIFSIIAFILLKVMRVTGCAAHHTVIVGGLHQQFINYPDVLRVEHNLPGVRLGWVLTGHEHVVAQRLDLYIVVKAQDL